VEAVDPANLPAVWTQLLAVAQSEHGPGLPALLQAGRLTSLDQEWAVIRYAANSTFPKMLERNGKKEQLRDAFAKVLQRSVGVKIEVDAESAPAPAPEEKPAAAPPASKPAPPVAEPVAAPPPPPTIALTAELKRTLESDPLIKTLLENLGGNIVKVE
jgi:hypothetical protein